MHLHMILPEIQPNEIAPPSTCPYQDCQGTRFRFHQVVTKPLKDTVHQEVTAHRYQCLTCRRTFREYPQGVSRAHVSERVKGLAVLLYLLGLSYGEVSLTLEAFGVYMCKSRVYGAVREAEKRLRRPGPGHLFEGIRTLALGGDVTSPKRRDGWLSLKLTEDSFHGLVLTAQDLSNEDAETLKARIEPIAAAIGGEVATSDGGDGLKVTAGQVGLTDQVCSVL